MLITAIKKILVTYVPKVNCLSFVLHAVSLAFILPSSLKANHLLDSSYIDDSNLTIDERLILAENIYINNVNNNLLHYAQTFVYEPPETPHKIAEDNSNVKIDPNKKNIQTQDIDSRLIDDGSVSSQNKSEEVYTNGQYNDPYESYNRFMYDVNKNIDTYTFKPVAKLYVFITPPPTKTMITNFFSNIQDISVTINYLLQWELENFGDTFARLVLNSSFGMAGLFDVATDIGFTKKSNDYGITFGKWGMTDSAYFVIPIMGPSTIRDTVGKAISAATSIGFYLPDGYQWSLTGLYIIDTRANFLTAEKIVNTISDDEYIFIRNSYINYRNSLINGAEIQQQREENESEILDNILDDVFNTKDSGNTDENPNNTTDKPEDSSKKSLLNSLGKDRQVENNNKIQDPIVCHNYYKINDAFLDIDPSYNFI